jgi:hypothetical protein
MQYAAKHGYTDLVEEVSPLLMAIPLEEVLSRLPQNLMIPWVRYYCLAFLYPKGCK